MSRFQLLLTAFVFFVVFPVEMSGTLDPLVLVTALTGSFALLLIVWTVSLTIEPASSPARVRAIALRERARRTAFLRLRDPGAAGNARPRAPSAASAAACLA
ncbi:DUF6412 domain-containing protein [Amycolatopsis sp. H20-H5]|uniref:DUF6412 domain-containing protein n=1 Tax=Amycolatopsis sp. H20-H5 TaxID=3046309 RepID=UPI002DBE2E3A|nr:DUF6412 domain-containing protein [Amycolatopsis sp. H20-H5]MEC3979317.1 DUF6412 domain-containing protein [Amycolatopsis sp. H20-H5]